MPGSASWVTCYEQRNGTSPQYIVIHCNERALGPEGAMHGGCRAFPGCRLSVQRATFRRGRRSRPAPGACRSVRRRQHEPKPAPLKYEGVIGWLIAPSLSSSTAFVDATCAPSKRQAGANRPKNRASKKVSIPPSQRLDDDITATPLSPTTPRPSWSQRRPSNAVLLAPLLRQLTNAPAPTAPTAPTASPATKATALPDVARSGRNASCDSTRARASPALPRQHPAAPPWRRTSSR